MKNPTLVFFDTSYGYAATAVRTAGRDLTEKDLRKWWKHYADRTPRYIDVAATYENDENDEGDTVDITRDWVCHECAKYAEAHYNIFN